MEDSWPRRAQRVESGEVAGEEMDEPKRIPGLRAEDGGESSKRGRTEDGGVRCETGAVGKARIAPTARPKRAT